MVPEPAADPLLLNCTANGEQPELGLADKLTVGLLCTVMVSVSVSNTDELLALYAVSVITYVPGCE